MGRKKRRAATRRRETNRIYKWFESVVNRKMPPTDDEDLVACGCIYADDPDDPMYRLTPDDLRGMDLVGLPIRVEHGDNDCGEVTDAWVSNEGKAFVRWRFADSPRGWALAKLVRDGKACELSLKHAEWDDGSKSAVEVSVVERGARPGTKIAKKVPRKYICASIRFTEASTMAEAPVSVAPVAESAPAAARLYERNSDGTFRPHGEPQQQDPVQQQAEPDAETKKRAAEDSAATGEDPRRVKMKSDIHKAMQITEQILPNLDPSVSAALTASLADIVKNHVYAEEILETTKKELVTLQVEKDKLKTRDRDVIKEIVEGITGVLTDFGSAPTEDNKKIMARVMEENPDFLDKVGRPLMVAASRISALRGAAVAAQRESALDMAQKQLQDANERLKALGVMHMGAPVAAAPAWVPVVSPPAVTVAASGREAAPAPQGYSIPDILKDMPAYTGVVGRVKLTDIFSGAPKI